ncbi:MAG: response regulator [Anaeromyxobacteraceae bacterium]
MIPVLIVDDSLTVRMDLDEAFSASGFAPVLCADLACARAALAARRFALAVVDVLLPDGDGLELLGEIRSDPARAAMPVVLLSSEAEVRDRVRGLKGGADEYVGKPYDAAYVVARARNLVRGREEVPEGPPRPLVLVVDDSVTAREALRAVLERAGLEVVVATSGEEGLRVAADRRPAAVVIDSVLPGLDGPTFVRQLRADAVLRGTPCMLLTGSGSIGELGALEAGADAYLRKDEGEAVVLARIQALLRTSIPASALGTTGFLAPQRLLAVGGGPALEAVLERLRGDGHDVVRAATGAEAFELLAVDRVEAILLELAAPGAGVDACARLKANPACRDLPLIALAADGDDDAAAVAAINAGADDVVPGAMDPDVVRARVRAQLRRKQFGDEHRHREAYARSAAVLETISDAFFAVDRTWRLVYVNRPCELLLGGARAELLGRTLWEACAHVCSGPFEPELRRAVADDAPVTFEAPVAPDRFYEVRAFPHADGLSAYLRDVTERRRTAEVQAHLVAIVSHDLRTPLTAITATSQGALRDRALGDKQRRAFERISTSAGRMARLINDILDYSRSRLGKGLPTNPQAVDLDEICREIVAEVEASHPSRVVRYQHEGDGRGEWDRDRIQQLLTNLLTNALRHGDPEAPVSLAWRAADGEKVIVVHNEGTPIEQAMLGQVFEPFRRGRRTGGQGGGVGLGLYIVQQIVLAHGGSIAVRTGDGEGTTFTVTLPDRALARMPDAPPPRA